MRNIFYQNKIHVFCLYAVIAIILIGTGSCKKYLEQKPRENLATPSSLNDLQAILDNSTMSVSTPDVDVLGDDYYLTTSGYNNAEISIRQSYIWAADAYPTIDNVWNDPYQCVYFCNFVLDNLPSVTLKPGEGERANNIKGTALFHRSFLFHQLAQLFCKPYTSASSGDPGIVVRLTADVNALSTRSTIQQTYDQIINDLKAAVDLLPVTSGYATRPTKAAANALLARVYLSMGDWTNAKGAANASLNAYNTLLDYNSLGPAADPVMPTSFMNNPEILYLSLQYGIYPNLASAHQMIVDTVLFRSYDGNDIRKKAFFGNSSGNNFFEGTYATGIDVNYYTFDGLAVDEVYLVRAECNARTGDRDGAMADLNTLMRKRWQTGTFTDITATDANDALGKVLAERQKELIFRGMRWSDVRRLNVLGANISLKRVVNGVTYMLPPGDLRSVLLIPAAEVSRSGIQQNPR